MGKTLVRASYRKYKKSAKGGKRTKRGCRVMKKSRRTKRRHMRGGWGEEKACIKDILSLSKLKYYIAYEWPKVTYDFAKRTLRKFDETDAKKLRNEFVSNIRTKLDENIVGRFDYSKGAFNTLKDPDSFKFKGATYEELIEGLRSIKNKSDCKGVALYYLTIVKVLKDYYFIIGLQPPPPVHEVANWIHAQDAERRGSTPPDIADAEAAEAAANQAAADQAAADQAANIKLLKAAGFTESELKAAGFTESELEAVPLLSPSTSTGGKSKRRRCAVKKYKK